MATATVTSFYRIYELPWSMSAEQEQAFRRILLQTVGAVLLLTIILSVLPTPQPDPTEVKEIPKRFAKLVLEKKPPPPPPPVVKEEPPPEPEKVVKEEPKPEPEPEKVVEREPEPPKPDETQVARDNAKVAGLLPFAEELADLRDNDTLDKLNDNNDLLGNVGGDAPIAERSLITSRAGRASGGINTAKLSRNTGGSGLAGRSTTQVESPVAGLAAAGGARRTGSSNKASRSREEIEMVFDRNKGAIYALYNRALRKDPSLEGKLVLRLTIAPDGSVTFCEVVSSELGDADLERKLVQRVLLFRFQAKDVEAVTTTKPIDFFPA